MTAQFQRNAEDNAVLVRAAEAHHRCDSRSSVPTLPTSQYTIALPTTSAITPTDDVGTAIFFDFLFGSSCREAGFERLVLLERLYVTCSTLPSVLLSWKDIVTDWSWCLKVSEAMEQSSVPALSRNHAYFKDARRNRNAGTPSQDT